MTSNLIFLAGFATYVIIRGVFERRTAGQASIVRRIDRLEIALMATVFIGNLGLPVVYLATGWLSFADYRLPTLVAGCGTAVMGVALWLFWRSHADLGRHWSTSLELRLDHRVVEHGVYRSIRHPMYASIWLFGLAQALLLQNWLAGWSALLTFAPMYFIRTPREERMMIEFFGERYRDYMRRTGRLLPRWRRGG